MVRRWVAGLAALLALTVALVLLQGHDPPAEQAVVDGDTEAGFGPAPVVDLGERGWRLDDGLVPPAAVDGMRRVQVLDLDYAEPPSSLALDGRWRIGGTRFAVLWCDGPTVDDPRVQPPELTLTFAEGTVVLPCSGRAGDPPVGRLHPLPPPDRDVHQATPTWAGDRPASGRATLAIYLESLGVPPRQGTPLPAPDPPAASALLGPGTPVVSHRGRPVHVQAVTLDHTSRLQLWAGDTGLLPVSVDGVIATDDGDLALGGGDWRAQDPQLRAGSWHVSTAGTGTSLPVPADLLPAPGERRTVVLSVPAARTLPRTWSVVVVPGTGQDPPPDPVAAQAVPAEEAGGPGRAPRAVATWRVPRDGQAHRLDVPAGVDPGAVLFLATAADPEAADPSALTVGYAGRIRTLPVLPGGSGATGIPEQGWRPPGNPAGTDRPGLWATLTPAPGHPEVTLTAWASD